MVSGEDNKDAVRDGPNITKEQWFALAALFAVLTFMLFAYVAFRVLFQSGLGSVDAMIVTRTGGALLAFGGAATTFFTILYRTKITEEQVAQSRRQNDSRDKADEAILLEKAASFLSADDLPTRGAGLAMLETIVRAPDSLYAQYALELATDQLVPCFESDGDGKPAVIERIYAVLQAGHARELWPKHRRNFEFKENTNFRNPRLQLAIWTPVCRFAGAFFYLGAAEAERLNSDKAKHWKFDRCIFVPSGILLRGRFKPITVSAIFYQCKFSKIPIARIEDFFGIDSENDFKECDLSNTVFGEISDIKRNKFSKCFYREGQPPKLENDPVGEEEVEFKKFLRGLQERKRPRSEAKDE